MIRRPPRSTLSSSSAASDVYKRQGYVEGMPQHFPLQIGWSNRASGLHHLSRPSVCVAVLPSDFLSCQQDFAPPLWRPPHRLDGGVRSSNGVPLARSEAEARLAEDINCVS